MKQDLFSNFTQPKRCTRSRIRCRPASRPRSSPGTINHRCFNALHDWAVRGMTEVDRVRPWAQRPLPFTSSSHAYRRWCAEHGAPRHTSEVAYDLKRPVQGHHLPVSKPRAARRTLPHCPFAASNKRPRFRTSAARCGGPAAAAGADSRYCFHRRVSGPVQRARYCATEREPFAGHQRSCGSYPFAPCRPRVCAFLR